jgi:hypothetical protein
VRALAAFGRAIYLRINAETAVASGGTTGLFKPQNPHAGLSREIRLIKGHARGKGGHMFVFISLEASQPTGKTYRLVLGCLVQFKLASTIALHNRLF